MIPKYRHISATWGSASLFCTVSIAVIGYRFANAQPLPDDDAPPGTSVVRHEPVPAKRGLVGAPGDQPAVLIESPSEVPVADSNPAILPDTSDDIVYRTRDTGGSEAATTVQNVPETVRPDRDTAREPWLNYHAVFDPAVIPFKRNSAKDTVLADGSLVVGDKAFRTVAVYGNRAVPGREVFYGSILVDFEPSTPIPIPSVSPDSNILQAEAIPSTPLEFFRDGADNLFVSSSTRGRVRLKYTLDAPSTWFSFRPSQRQRFTDIPEPLRPTLPNSLRRDVDRVITRIGINTRDGYVKALRKLVWWFRSFHPGELSGPTRDLYLELALSRRGVCRHRVYAFIITAHGLGIPARYVSNEAHVFAEVFMPTEGWLRIDLGGGAQGMNVRGASDVGLHTSQTDDPWGYPEGFRTGYSQRAFGGADRSGEPVRGMPAIEAPVGRSGGHAAGQQAVRASARSPFAINTSMKQSKTVLTTSAASVYRGEPFVVSGTVRTSGGKPIEGGLVRIQLMDMGLHSVVVTLGHIRTDAAGAFKTTVTISTRVSPGQWQVIAEFLGDGVYGPSHSE